MEAEQLRPELFLFLLEQSDSNCVTRTFTAILKVASDRFAQIKSEDDALTFKCNTCIESGTLERWR